MLEKIKERLSSIKTEFTIRAKAYETPEIINIEDAYLKYELIKFPKISAADEVYSESYIAPLYRITMKIYDKLPTCSDRQLVGWKDCFRGIVLGDMYGSPYEHFADKAKNYDIHEVELQTPGNWTDDTLMTIAAMRVIKELEHSNLSEEDTIRVFAEQYRLLAQKYPYAGYGGAFYDWAVMKEDNPSYMSYGDGSAMRAGIIGALALNLQDCIMLAALSALPTHAHPEGIKGAVCTAVITYYACHGADKNILREIAYIFYPHGASTEAEYYRADFGYLRPDLSLDEIIALHPLTLKPTCQIAVPLAISLLLMSDSHLSFLKHLSKLPMDADTVGAIMGGAMAAWDLIHDDGAVFPIPDKKYFDESAEIQPEEIKEIFEF